MSQPCQVCANFGAMPYTGEHTRAEEDCLMHSTHTPGPWTAQPIGDETEANILGAGRELVATVSDNDALLIAAAPELKDFLLDVPHNDMTATHRLVKHVAGCRGCEARALLAKIEGRSI